MSKLINRFKGIKALVIGDMMIDAYYFGKVDRISPEAPVPVVAVTGKDNRLGGAANVALNLKALGAVPIICSVIGDDEAGKSMLELFNSNGINTDGVVVSDQRITTVKLRIMSQAHQLLRVDTEQTQAINLNENQRLVNQVKLLMKECQVVIFEDYDKGVITELNIAEITVEANKLGIPVVVDPKKRNFNHYKKATLFKPNLKELREGLNQDLNLENKQAFETAISQMLATNQQTYAMVTLSEKGVMITDGNHFDYVPAHVRKIADVSGAGDTVISVTALCMAIGLKPLQIAQAANLAGGLVCEEVGVVPINAERFDAELSLLGL